MKIKILFLACLCAQINAQPQFVISEIENNTKEPIAILFYAEGLRATHLKDDASHIMIAPPGRAKPNKTIPLFIDTNYRGTDVKNYFTAPVMISKSDKFEKPLFWLFAHRVRMSPIEIDASIDIYKGELINEQYTQNTMTTSKLRLQTKEKYLVDGWIKALDTSTDHEKYEIKLLFSIKNEQIKADLIIKTVNNNKWGI